jgi:hypothetical protein
VTPGKPDAKPPGTEEAAALMSESKELTTPDGSAVTGRLTPDGRLDGTSTPGIDVTPALMSDNNELTSPVGRAVTMGKPDDRLEGTTPGTTEPAFMFDSSELMIPLGIAVTAGKPETRPEGKRPAADDIMALASLRMGAR